MDFPGLDVREDRVQRGVDRSDHVGVHLVSLKPLNEDAALPEPLVRRPIEFLTEEARDPGAVGIRRFRENDVVVAIAREE